jgi:signal transduction histidine kinase/ligand-binding sensor domain-containing protein
MLVVLFLIQLLPGTASALDPERALYQLNHTAWTAQDGAPSQVSAMVQAADGHLWIGSARGLYRFDGIAFERFQPAGEQGLPSYNVYALAAMPDSGLWISFRPSGLGLLKHGAFRSFTQPDEIPDGPVFALAGDQDGRIWAATLSGLELREGDSWSRIGPAWGIPRERIWNLLVDRAGTLWVATADRLYSLARGARAFRDEGVHEVGTVRHMAEAPDGTVWLCGQQLRPAAGSGARGAMTPSIGSGSSHFLFDRDGSLWIAISGEGLKRVAFPDSAGHDASRPPYVESFGEPQGLTGVQAMLLEDREGDIWVGTEKGIDRFRHNHLVPVRLPARYTGLLLHAQADGNVSVASANARPMLEISGGRVRDLGILSRIGSSCRDSLGVVWWGGIRGLWRQSGDALTQYPLPAGMAPEWIWEIFRSDIPGAVWASIGDHGLRHFDNGIWTDRRPPAGLPDRGPSASFRTADGSTWLGYTENRACLLSGDSVRAFYGRDGLTVGRIRVIRGRGPHFWFGGELGLALFHDGRFSTIRGRERGTLGTVSGIIETRSGDLWLNELEGIVHISAEEVRAVLRDTTHLVAFRRFDATDGFPGGGQMNWTNSTAVEATDGRLWFATDNGVAWIHPEQIRWNPVAPPVTIRAIRTDRQAYPPIGVPRLPPRTDDIRIDYAALSLSTPERVQYRYRLVGAGDTWRDAGTARTATFARLRPGRYRFEVLAANGDGVWATTAASAAFAVAPAYYQTWWFLVAMIGAVALSLWGLHRLRLRAVEGRLEKYHRERMAERMRIAHELHDTLLQGVMGASMQLHAIVEESPEKAPPHGRMRTLQGLLEQVIQDAREAVQGLRTAGSEDGGGPEKALPRIQLEGNHSYGGDFHVTTSGHARAWAPNARDEAYRILREAVLNAFRHSGSSLVRIESDYLDQEFRARVTDNGCGMESATFKGGRSGHWGLPGMRERAARLGAVLTVRSRVGSGTEVELRIPNHVAFPDCRPPGFWRRWLHNLLAGRRRPGEGR